MRLVVDVWQVVKRWGDEIDWRAFLERAGAWQMEVLTKSTLHALGQYLAFQLRRKPCRSRSPAGILSVFSGELQRVPLRSSWNIRFAQESHWSPPS
jgi:hypothetical protein